MNYNRQLQQLRRELHEQREHEALTDIEVQVAAKREVDLAPFRELQAAAQAVFNAWVHAGRPDLKGFLEGLGLAA